MEVDRAQRLWVTWASLTRRVVLIGIAASSIPSWIGWAAEPERDPADIVGDPSSLSKDREALVQRVASLRRAGRLTEAVAAAQQVVALTREALGETHPQVGGALQQLAALQSETEDWAAAQVTWQEVIQLGTRLFGASHYRVTDAMCVPRPLQQPHPPIMIGGVGRKVLLKLVATHCRKDDEPVAP